MSASKNVRYRAISQTSFIVACVVLLGAAITLNTATNALRLHFKKEPVPQPRDFHDLPRLMGGWLQVSEDEKLDKETQDTLGTDKYVYRDYIQVDKYGADLICASKADEKLVETAQAEIRSTFDGKSFDDRVKMIEEAFKDKTAEDRKQAMYIVQARHPDGVINMGLTYYTGLVDTVAHIPDRCYIAAGYEPKSYEQPTWNVGKDAAGNDKTLAVRFISFEDQTGTHQIPKCVAYVFHVNGHYESDPIGVRVSLQDLTKRYGYYAKIELMTLGNDTGLISSAMADFLASARPQIETCFPDWVKLNQSGK